MWGQKDLALFLSKLIYQIITINICKCVLSSLQFLSYVSLQLPYKVSDIIKSILQM